MKEGEREFDQTYQGIDNIYNAFPFTNIDRQSPCVIPYTGKDQKL